MLASLLFAVAFNESPDDSFRMAGMLVGVQAWTFSRYTAFEAIEKTAKAGAKCIELYPGQVLDKLWSEIKVGPDMSPEATRLLKNKLTATGIKVVAFGVTEINKDQAEARKLFQWVKDMGIGIIQTESVDALDTIEKMVRELDIKVGFHNHPRRPDDPTYRMWDPNYVLKLVQKRDRRIGACADTGHWVRSGIRPIDALRILRGRIISSHLKDLNEFSPNGHDVPYGMGVSDVPAILDELRRQRFAGSISVEYENNWESSIPEVAQCLGFVRGYLRGR